MLKHVDLEAAPGQMSGAWWGQPSAGKNHDCKSADALLRDTTADRSTIDGQDIQLIKGPNLRRQLGIVLPGTYCFAGTVIDNIRYGRLDATDDEVIAAAKHGQRTY